MRRLKIDYIFSSDFLILSVQNRELEYPRVRPFIYLDRAINPTRITTVQLPTVSSLPRFLFRMNPLRENSTPASADNHSSKDDRIHSPPAFLDLADSTTRLGPNMPDLSARVELKRIEHERQRAFQRKMFEDQRRVLEHQQRQELLSIPYDPNAPNGATLQHLAVSAPTTPPRINAVLHDSLFKAVGSAASAKRKSVAYAPSVDHSPDPPRTLKANGQQPFARPAGAKSMPASRRTSASGDDEDLAGHLQGLSLVGERSNNRLSPVPASVLNRNPASRYAEEDVFSYAATYNAGIMLDEQLDQEMHNAMKNLPTSDDDKYHASYTNKLSVSSAAALDLAHISQTSPRTTFASRAADNKEKSSSEWPLFPAAPRGHETVLGRDNTRRAVTNPNLTVSPPQDSQQQQQHAQSQTQNQQQQQPQRGNSTSNSPTSLLQHPQQFVPHAHNQPVSRRGSPGSMESFSTTRSVPATPHGMANSASGHHIMTPATPRTPDSQAMNGRVTAQAGPHQPNDQLPVSAAELQASLSRVPSGQYDNAPIGYIQHGMDESIQPYAGEGVYSLNDSSEARYNSYGFEANQRRGPNNGANPNNALYHHNAARYGLGMPGRPNAGGGGDSKMNGLHGPKHKRADVDREFNRFTGTRLEDLQGEIHNLCKDQHGCRYLQKKLEEGQAEHRDMIFRETFPHFADLMTDPFGNYLCQKMLEYSTDEQRNLICETVAQDLVTISLNMHGTRAVQKMIDFLSTRRQTDARYNAQIHMIIVALSMHVVVLIKDLNGNHVIQKCLNKLSPEDNQFIFNAVAANCVEVATHRHGCCVLQRCVDHASDHQRVQLVQEITYNALTLVQDPYGNYVVQYILDLNDNRFSDAVIRQFTGNVCALSVQKFSSNVIEKCIRVAEHSTRKMLIEELLNRTRLEKLLRDSYGNYCVQTALDYAEPAQRAMLVEGIRPVLPLIRNTPYGKRIQNKLQREQLDHYPAGYHNQAAMMALGGRGVALAHHPHGGRHVAQAIHQNHLAEIYGANAIYALQAGSAAAAAAALQGHMTPQMHALQAPTIDGYVLQGGSPHAQGISPTHAFAGFAADPYQRTSFGYGM